MPGLRRLALEAAKGQSAVGSWGHDLARPDGRLKGYGMMNSPGVPLTIGLVVARAAGIKDPEFSHAIELSLRLLRFYIGKGAIPYGDHHPWIENHDGNGKCGMAAVLFNLLAAIQAPGGGNGGRNRDPTPRIWYSRFVRSATQRPGNGVGWQAKNESRKCLSIMKRNTVSCLIVLGVWHANALAAEESEMKTRSRAVTIQLNSASRGRVFEGIGAVSAGASTRLLPDYPEPQRAQILDFLYKPKFGAGFQHLKVEIGSGENSTCGSEPSHVVTRAELTDPKPRGYEFWLTRPPDQLVSSGALGLPHFGLLGQIPCQAKSSRPAAPCAPPSPAGPARSFRPRRNAP